MSLDLHTVSIKSGSNPPSDLAKLACALLISVAVPGPVGEMVSGWITNVGAGYTSIPTGAAAGGSGGTITPSMSISTSAANAAGATYAPGDTITLTGGTAATQGLLEVLTTKMVTAPAVAAAGNGYNVGDNITLTPGGAVVQVATLTGGAGTGVATVTIVSGGSFTSNNTSAGGLTQASTTGGGSGATFTMTAAKYGVNTYAVQNAGSYSALPSNPVSQGSSSGSGTGFQVNINTWQLQSFTASGGTGYPHGAAVTFTGGGATTAAAGLISTLPIAQPQSVSESFTLPPGGAMIQVEPNGPCNVAVAKSTTGFTVTLSPRTTSEPLLASAFDALVLH